MKILIPITNNATKFLKITNQKISGSSPAGINRVLCGKDLDRLVWYATTDVRGPVLQWTMRLTMNQKIASCVLEVRPARRTDASAPLSAGAASPLPVGMGR